MSYTGRERRTRQIIITENTEYHLKGCTCVAVRDYHTGQLQKNHQALGKEVVGHVRFDKDGSWQLCVGHHVGVGQRVFFTSQLLTSPVRAVRRSSAHVSAH